MELEHYSTPPTPAQPYFASVLKPVFRGRDMYRSHVSVFENPACIDPISHETIGRSGYSSFRPVFQSYTDVGSMYMTVPSAVSPTPAHHHLSGL